MKRRFFSVLMALIVLISIFPKVNVKAAGIEYPKSLSAYLTSESLRVNGYGLYYIDVKGLSKDQRIFSSIKSSDPSVAIVHSVQNVYTSSKTTKVYKKAKNSNLTEKNSRLVVNIYKAGKCTISFKVGNVYYSTQLNVIKVDTEFADAAKSVSITGYYKGKNLVPKMSKYTNEINYFKSKDVKHPILKVKTKKGWRLTGVSSYDSKTGYKYTRNSAKGINKFDLRSMSKQGGEIRLSFTHTKSGLSCFTYLEFNTSGTKPIRYY